MEEKKFLMRHLFRINKDKTEGVIGRPEIKPIK